MAERELNRSERAAIRKLVTELCANYDSQDKICLPLDSSCYMLNKWWTGAYCRYFEKSVLPVDAALESAITGEDTSMRQKICPVCGKAYLPTGILGCIMNIVQTLSFACTASVIYKKKHTLSGAVIGLASGWLITVIVMLLWNYLVTPLYMGYPREAVVELLLPAFLPFNLLKGGLNASITFLLYKPIVTALRKSGYVATLENEARQKHTGLLILASFIIVTCVLIILSMNGII